MISDKAVKLFNAGKFAKCFAKKDFTAVKVHVGEHGNNTHIKAPCLKGLVKELLKLKTRPFLTDTNVLYASPRHDAIGPARRRIGPAPAQLSAVPAPGRAGR